MDISIWSAQIIYPANKNSSHIILAGLNVFISCIYIIYIN